MNGSNYIQYTIFQETPAFTLDQQIYLVCTFLDRCELEHGQTQTCRNLFLIHLYAWMVGSILFFMYL